MVSRSHALKDATNYISSCLERRLLTMGIFIDRRKAFDTVDHNILLKKLEFYGMRGVSGDFLRSYISDRSQYVSIYNSNSSVNNVMCGVPQGSVLGPILFNLYINDIVNVSDKLRFVWFADDTNILYSSKEIENVENTVNIEMSKIHEWLCTNRLSINLSKTNYMAFDKIKARSIPSIYINNHKI